VPGKLLLDTSVIIEMMSGDAAAQRTTTGAEQQHDLTVATRDAHFREIEDLDLLSW
jgi:predicted nucleic acid-binding protein